MKQSTKLLSLVLALVMAFSCMTVVGSALKADVSKEKMTYDSVDDAVLTPEQAATVILNYLDSNVMPDLGVMDLSVLGTLDLTSVDSAVSSIYDLLDNSLLAIVTGDVANLRSNRDLLKGVQRSGGDLEVIYALLNYLGASKTVSVVKKAPYGLLTSKGISLGSLLNGIVKGFMDISEVNDILTNIGGYLTKEVYDMLIHGSYNASYTNESYPAAEDLDSLPAEVDTLDEMIDYAVAGLLVNPQKYTWKTSGETSKKDWDKGSLVMPTVAKKFDVATVASYLSLSDSANSIFALIDKIAPYAIYDLGINPLNNNLKKELFEGVEAELKEISVSSLPADVKTAFETEKAAGKESFMTYISEDKIFHSSADGEWYYTTLKKAQVTAADGSVVKDEDGNAKTESVRKYYRINTAAANSFYELINWDWEITAPNPTDESTKTGEANELDYEAIIAQYGSITQALNHLVYIVADNALSDYAKEYFNEVVYGDTTAGNPVWKDGATSAKEGNSTVFVANLERLLKFLLAEYADKIFGSDSEYIDWEYADVENMSIVELIAHIGPTFFEDAMPQLIIPKDESGLAAFHDGVQLLEFGALVIREFMTEIAPAVNYDAQIFEEGTLTSAEGRQFASHTADEWFNLILNMGMDIAYTYLNQITNFHTEIPAQEITESRWQNMLDAAILWAVGYVSSPDKASGVLAGISYNEVNAVSGPLNKLSYILNTILPLGFVNGCTTEAYDFDVATLFGKLENLFKNFDLDEIVSLFGRNTDAKNNLLNTGDVVTAVLTLADDILALVFRTQILGDKTTISTVLANDNLSTVISNLLTQLKNSKEALLLSALPAACKLVSDFGGEQELGNLKVSLPTTVNLSDGNSPTKDGALKTTFKIVNSSSGLWRGYKDAEGDVQKDNHYTYTIKSVTPYNYDGSACTYITSTTLDKTTLDYGDVATATYQVTGVPSDNDGVIVRYDIVYTVSDEDGNQLGGQDYTVSKYSWLSYNGTSDEATKNKTLTKKGTSTGIYTPQYIDMDNIEDELANMGAVYIDADPDWGSSNRVEDYKISGTTVDGMTPGVAAPDTEKEYILGSNTKRQFWNITVFTNGSYLCTKGSDEEEGDRYLKVSGASFDSAAWKATNKKEGDTTTIPFTFYTKTKGGTEGNGSGDLVIKYFSSVNHNKLTDLVNDETKNPRKKVEYHTDDATYYADRLLRTVDVSEDYIKETTSNATAWVDDNGKVYDDSQVENIKTEKYTNSEVIKSQTGKVGEISVKNVTALNGKTVWDNYYANLEIGMRGAWQGSWRSTSLFNQGELYANLYISSVEVGFIKLSAEELTEIDGAVDIDSAVDALETKLDSVEAQYSDTKDYTDYEMYRWNRYNDVRKDARNIVNAKKAASYSEPDSKFFPYKTSVTQTDINGIVANSENASIIGSYVGGTDNANMISALLEDYTAEEMVQRNKDLSKAKASYAGVSALDVAQASNLLDRIPARLLTRDGGVVKTHIKNEIDSANNMIGKDNSDGLYTDRSWTKYIAALKAAEAVYADADSSQMQVFDAKWELLTCRNELVLVEDEADYSELEELIAQAKNALANQNLYDNTAKELGQVLAELGFGYDDEGNAVQVSLANGEKVDLFPGSAEYVNHEPYSWGDQKYIDRAATALKEALAVLKFKGADVTRTDGGDAIKDIVLVEADEDNEIEEVRLSNVAIIGSKLDAAAVKALFSESKSEDSIVSADINYSAAQEDVDGFVGTNATITFYKTIDEVKVPVATVKLVVEGDVNGDGIVNVLDASITQIVSTAHAELDGAFHVAAKLTGDASAAVNANDYAAVVNKALA